MSVAVEIDHTIVHAADPLATTSFISEILGIPPATRLGHFTVLRVGGMSLDFLPDDPPIAQQHYAFRVSEADFDMIFARLQARDIAYWADPFRTQSGQINHWDDGRGVYFDDPNGHLLEVITRSYGSGGCHATHPNPLLEC